MSIEQKDIETLVREGLDQLNKGNLEGWLQIYDSNAVLHGFPGVEPGLEGIRKFYQGFLAAFPDMNVTIEDIFKENDKIAFRITIRGTHKGELMGIPSTGKSISVPSITILHFKNGKCIERWTQADFVIMMQQLGINPS
jgi:steroid delta-isomerase-like uncharacterized protein